MFSVILKCTQEMKGIKTENIFWKDSTEIKFYDECQLLIKDN